MNKNLQTNLQELKETIQDLANSARNLKAENNPDTKAFFKLVHQIVIIFEKVDQRLIELENNPTK